MTGGMYGAIGVCTGQGFTRRICALARCSTMFLRILYFVLYTYFTTMHTYFACQWDFFRHCMISGWHPGTYMVRQRREGSMPFHRENLLIQVYIHFLTIKYIFTYICILFGVRGGIFTLACIIGGMPSWRVVWDIGVCSDLSHGPTC